LSNAGNAGILGAQSLSTLSGHLGTVVVAGAAGKPMEDIESSDVTLVTVLLDASSSIQARGLEQAVRDAYNLLLHTFSTSREVDNIMMALWIFADGARVVHSYVPVRDAARLDANIYRTGGSTRLYDTWLEALAANVAYAQQLRDGGTPCRSIAVVITDGEDVGSSRRARDCAPLALDLLRSEQFALAFVGVGTDVDFRRVAKEMGLPDASIHVQSTASAKGLHDAFYLVSQSAIRMSRSWVAPGNSGGFFN
jgi:hypothetical protein